MSSLIEVLKTIQDEQDLDSRDEARAHFDQQSAVFANTIEAAYPEADEFRALLPTWSLYAEYWMNQWVGADHGDWGKLLRRVVRELKAEPTTERADLGSYSDLVEPELTDEQVDTLAAMVPEIGESVGGGQVIIDDRVAETGTVKIGKNLLEAARFVESGQIVYTTKSGRKTASPRVAKSFTLSAV